MGKDKHEQLAILKIINMLIYITIKDRKDNITERVVKYPKQTIVNAFDGAETKTWQTNDVLITAAVTIKHDVDKKSDIVFEPCEYDPIIEVLFKMPIPLNNRYLSKTTGMGKKIKNR